MMRFLPVNTNALLVELDDLDQTLALLASLTEQPIAGVEGLVPAARTLLVSYRPSAQSFATLVEAIAGRTIGTATRRGGTLIEIPVRYDGEDLAEVAQILGITAEEVVRRHTGSEYIVAFTGFAPGFAYLAGGHPGLNVPRRASPRTRIPAGSVGLAGSFSGVYPQASPGGWQIIGTTSAVMWDIEREVPALLQPGYRVRFVDAASLPAGERMDAAPPEKARPTSTASVSATALDVLSPGLQTLFEDTGRHGQAAQGVSASGAMDQGACKSANRLVGNPSDAACLETVNGGLRLRSRGATVVAVTGADAPVTITSGCGARWQAPRYQPFALDDGDVVAIGHPVAGARCYIAVRGGFAVSPVLGSCSTDTLAQVGPAPLAAGDVLMVRPARPGAVVEVGGIAPCGLPTTDAEVSLDVVLGPRTDWFTPEAVALLRTQRWKVTPQSNRVGIRLAGEIGLARAIEGELPSEGTALGAIQVPANGQPVLFLADHPLTGGYPVIGAVAPYHLDLAGQIPVGAWVRFRPIGPFAPVTRPLHADAGARSVA
jgi:KipI family sensor histidine kinase inhibitor